MSKKKLQSHELQEAVRIIPSLIVEEIRKNAISASQHNTSSASAATSLKALPTHAVYVSPLRSRRWMFIGVGACLLTILGFWFVYITDTIEQNKLTLNPAKAFADSGQNDLSMLIATFTKMENELKVNIKSPGELKIMVAEALMPLLAASSTTSTAAATTSTAIVTTTP